MSGYATITVVVRTDELVVLPVGWSQVKALLSDDEVRFVTIEQGVSDYAVRCGADLDDEDDRNSDDRNSDGGNSDGGNSDGGGNDDDAVSHYYSLGYHYRMGHTSEPGFLGGLADDERAAHQRGLTAGERDRQRPPGTAVNTAIAYLYRDAANYKQHERLVLPGAITPAERAALVAHLHLGCYFKAELMGLEDLRERWDSRYDDDPAWHELRVDDIGHTLDPPRGHGVHQDVHEFVARFWATDWQS